MPKIARTYYDERDGYDFADEANKYMKFGVGLQQMQANQTAQKAADLNLKQEEAKFNEWSSPDAVQARKDKQFAESAEAMKAAALAIDDQKVSVGTAAQEFEQGYIANTDDPLDVIIKNTDRFWSERTNGKFKLSHTPTQREDGSTAYIINAMDNKGNILHSFDAANKDEFRMKLGGLRQGAGFVSLDTRNKTLMLADAMKSWLTLKPEERARVGNDFGRLSEDQELYHKVMNMTGAKQTDVQYGEERDIHGMRSEKHAQDMELGNSQIATDKARRSSIYQSMGIERDEHEYIKTVVRPIEERVKSLEIEGKTTQVAKGYEDLIDAVAPDLAASTPAAIDPLSGDPNALGVLGAATPRGKSFTPEQLEEREYIMTKIRMSELTDMEPTQRIAFLRDEFAEAKKKRVNTPGDPLYEADPKRQEQRRKVDNTLGAARKYLNERDMLERETSWGGAPALGIGGVLDDEERKRRAANRPQLMHR